jgi:hypothetical protein
LSRIAGYTRTTLLQRRTTELKLAPNPNSYAHMKFAVLNPRQTVNARAIPCNVTRTRFTPPLIEDQQNVCSTWQENSSSYPNVNQLVVCSSSFSRKRSKKRCSASQKTNLPRTMLIDFVVVKKTKSKKEYSGSQITQSLRSRPRGLAANWGCQAIFHHAIKHMFPSLTGL